MSSTNGKSPAPGSPRSPRGARARNGRKAKPKSGKAVNGASVPSKANSEKGGGLATLKADADAVAAATPLALPEQYVTTRREAPGGLYEISSRDLQRVAALRRVHQFEPDASFAEAVLKSLVNQYGGNPNDPMPMRKGWADRPPAERELVRFGINLLKRVAPEVLEAVKLSAASWAAESTGLALHSIEMIARNPMVNSRSQGHALNACKLILELSGIIVKDKGGGVVVNVEAHAQAAAIDAVSADAITQVEAARQAMWDRAMGQGDDGDGSSYELAPAVEYEVE